MLFTFPTSCVNNRHGVIKLHITNHNKPIIQKKDAERSCDVMICVYTYQLMTINSDFGVHKIVEIECMVSKLTAKAISLIYDMCAVIPLKKNQKKTVFKMERNNVCIITLL